MVREHLYKALDQVTKHDDCVDFVRSSGKTPSHVEECIEGMLPLHKKRFTIFLTGSTIIASGTNK